MVSAPSSAAGGRDGVGDPRTGRQGHQARRVDQPDDADHDGLPRFTCRAAPGRGRPEDTISTGGSFAETTGAGRPASE